MSTQASAMPKLLILGIGNVIMSDDGVGVRVAQKLQAGYRMPEHVDIMDGGTLGLDILPRLEGIGRLLIVDAVETGSAPGTLVRLSGDEIPLALETRLSPHQMGLKDLLAVSLLMGHEPAEIVLIGIQPGSIEMGTELTPAVDEQIDCILENILGELSRWGVEFACTNVL